MCRGVASWRSRFLTISTTKRERYLGCEVFGTSLLDECLPHLPCVLCLTGGGLRGRRGIARAGAAERPNTTAIRLSSGVDGAAVILQRATRVIRIPRLANTRWY